MLPAPLETMPPPGRAGRGLGSGPGEWAGDRMSGMREGPTAERPSIGARVERAIEEHANAEREIERGRAESRAPRSLARTVFWLAVTAVSLYGVAPSLVDVLGSWSDLSQLNLAWFPAMAALQGGALACLWALQRIALKSVRWRDVVDS